MLRSLNSLERYKVTATDGDVGTVSDCLLEDHAKASETPDGERTYVWALRYLIVETGSVFHRRRVLVSPISIRDADAAERRFHLSLTIDKIKNSPNFDAEKPVSRTHEREYSQYYQYPYYWGYSGLWGMGTVPGALATDNEDYLRDDRPTEPGADARLETESHLQSARELVGYKVESHQGVVGHVEDLLLDDETYELVDLVVNTGNQSRGHKVVLATTEVLEINRADRRLRVNASRLSIVDGVRYAGTDESDSTEGDRDTETSALEYEIEGDARAAHEAIGAAGGAITGGILGAIAGPPGVAAGAVLGGIAGAVAEAALEKGADEEAVRTRELDAELGVSGGDMGAKNLRHPAAKRGVYSNASSGVGGSSGDAPAEGPIPPSR